MAMVLIPAAILISVLAYFVIMSLKRCAKDNDKLKMLVYYIEKTFLYRMILRTVMATFIQICIIGFAGYVTHPSGYMGTIMQVFGLVVGVCCFASVMFAAAAPQDLLESRGMRDSFGTLYDGIKTNAGSLKVANNSIFLARRALFVLALLQDEWIVRFSLITVLTLL